MPHPIHRVARFDIVGPYTLTVAFTDGTTQALSLYPGPKGNLKFPIDQPIPYAPIKSVVLLRVKQDRSRES